MRGRTVAVFVSVIAMIGSRPAAASDPTGLWMVSALTALAIAVFGGLLGGLAAFCVIRSRRAWSIWLPLAFVVFLLIGVAVARKFFWTPT